MQTVTGYDANALYLWCTRLAMQMCKPGVYRYNVDSEKMELSFYPGISEKQDAWLTDLCSVNFPHLRNAIKNGEMCVGPRRLKVDGYDSLSKTAFELDECYFHGCDMRVCNASPIKKC